MAKSTITREWLQQTIAELESVRDEIPFGIDTNSELELAAFKMALASMDSEPVAVVPEDVRQALSKMDDEIIAELDAEESACRAAMDSDPVVYASEETLAYAAHGELLLRVLSQPAGDAIIPLYRHAQPAPEYPETLPCPVLLEPGMRFGKGVKTRLVLEAIQRRAEYYAELEVMTPEERAEHDANMEAFKLMLPQPLPVASAGLDKNLSNDVLDEIIAEAKTSMEQYLALSLKAEREAWRQCQPTDDERIMAIEGIIPPISAGNSPVIPDGYVMVPREPTVNQWAAGVQAFDSGVDKVTRVYKAMLAAAPQEVKP